MSADETSLETCALRYSPPDGKAVPQPQARSTSGRLKKGRKNCHELNTNFPLIIFAQLTYYNIQSLLA
jgi:hypothetical protein